MPNDRPAPIKKKSTAARRRGVRSKPKLGLLTLIALWIVWGSSWPAMRVVFIELPVWQFRTVTCLIGGMALLALGLASGEPWRVRRALWGPLVLAAVFNMTLWHVLVGYGLANIGAGHGAIVCYTLPIWTAILSVMFLNEKFTARKVLALIFGMAGVVTLLSADFTAIGTRPIGLLFVLGAAISWAIGTIVIKRYDWSVGVYALAGWQLLIGLVPIATIAIATERFSLHEASAEAAWASAYVLFVAIIAGYALWFRVVEIFPVMVASIGALMIPVIGVVTGAIILKEPITWTEIGALIMVLIAISLVLLPVRGRSGRPSRWQIRKLGSAHNTAEDRLLSAGLRRCPHYKGWGGEVCSFQE